MTGRDRMVIVIVAIAAAIIGSWLLVIQPKRSQASKLGAQVKTEQSQLVTAQSAVRDAEAAKSAFAGSYTAMARLGEAVPADDNVPSLIYQIQSAASASRVDFRDLTLNGGSSAPGPAASASATQAATATLPPGATVGPAGFPIEPFTFTFRGNFFRLSQFLGRVQRFVVASNKKVSVSGRLLTLNAISLGAGPAGFPQITASIAATAYLVPASQGVLAGASASGPSSTSLPTSTSSSAAGTSSSAAGTSSSAPGTGSSAPSTSSTPTPAAVATPPTR
jgi:type II secretory pathway pseudopilin PulG